MARTQKDLAKRAAGFPAQLKVVHVIGDNDNTLVQADLPMPGDVVVSVVEFYPPSLATTAAVAATHTGTITGRGSVTVGGSAISSGRSVLVYYYSFG